MLQRGFQAEPFGQNSPDKSFSFLIRGDGHCEINVPREPWIRSHGHAKAADQRPLTSGLGQQTADVLKNLE